MYLWAVGFVLLLAYGTGPAFLQAQSHTVWDGVFSAAQVDRGQDSYDLYCSACHGFDLSGLDLGQPQLAGEIFRRRWDASTVNELFSKVSTTMPQNSPGALGADVYIDIISHIFASNGFPSGEIELTFEPEVMADISIVGINGPLPADTGSLVRAVGCFSRSGAGEWMLMETSGALRTRDMNESMGADRLTAESTLLGTEDVLLVGYVPPEMEAHLGRRVEAKGLLILSPNEASIRITSVQMISETCD
jgi:hypothetical protein